MDERGYDITGGYSRRYSQDQNENPQMNNSLRQEIGKENEQPKRSFIKTFAIFFGAIIVVGVIIGAIYSLGGFNKKISDNKLIEGATLELGENKNVKFSSGNEDHSISIDFLGTDSVELTISSDPIKLKLKINEIQEVDIDGDNITDLLVKINKITGGKVEVAIRKIETLECLQEWTCGNWSECTDGMQQRTCSDENFCGGNFGKPPEEKRCNEMNNINWTNNGNWSREKFEERIKIEEQKRTLEQEKENLSEEEYKSRLEEINKSLQEYTQEREKERLEIEEKEKIENQTREKLEETLNETEESEGSSTEDEEYLAQIKNLDCSNYLPPNCGILNIASLSKRSYEIDTSILEESLSEALGTGESEFRVFDESCEAVCFGNAFRKNCEEAELIIIEEDGTEIKMNTIPPESSNTCKINFSYKKVGNNHPEYEALENRYAECQISTEEEKLSELSCSNFGACLEKDLPGQTVQGIVQEIQNLIFYQDSSCKGTMIEAQETNSDSDYLSDCLLRIFDEGKEISLRENKIKYSSKEENSVTIEINNQEKTLSQYQNKLWNDYSINVGYLDKYTNGSIRLNICFNVAE